MNYAKVERSETGTDAPMAGYRSSGASRKGEIMQVAIRLILSAILIYFVWRETGWATATAISLITVGNELSALAIKNIIKSVQILVGR